jgi:hypothetical protein
MTAKPRLTDAALEAALARYARRVSAEGLHVEIMAGVEATDQARGPLLALPGWLARPAAPGRLAAVPAVAWLLLLTGLLLGLIAGLVVGAGHAHESITSVASPSPSPSPSPSGTPRVGSAACVVATLAGKPGVGGTADGTGAEARFGFESFDIAIDGSVLFLADSANHTIRRITRQGVVTTLAGKPGQAGSTDGVGAAARFDRPAGIAVDRAGNIYTADANNHTIRRITPNGTVDTLAGTAGEAGSTDGVGAAARFRTPMSIAVDVLGNVYVGEKNSGTIRRIAPDGTVTTLAPRLTGMAWDMAVDQDGDLWVVDVAPTRDASWLRKVTADGAMATVEIPWTRERARVSDIWIDPAGTVFATAFIDHVVVRATVDGTLTTLAGGRDVGMADGPGDVAMFDGPLGIAGDTSGVLYVVDAGNAVVRSVTCP